MILQMRNTPEGHCRYTRLLDRGVIRYFAEKRGATLVDAF